MEGERVIIANDKHTASIYCSNRVVTTKYTMLTIIPLLLYHHCQRFMNLYFLLVGCLQLWRDVSPVDPWSCWGPIIFIFSLTFIREGLDDLRQHRNDKRINNRKYTVILQNGEKTVKKSKDIKVGQIIELKSDEECPADIVLLASSNEDGTCFISTANLDGESNLKERTAPHQTQKIYLKNKLKNLMCFLKCGKPSADLYSFEAKLYFSPNDNSFNSNSKKQQKNLNNSFHDNDLNNKMNESFDKSNHSKNNHMIFHQETINDNEGDYLPLTKLQLIQSGTILKSPDVICGIVCFTGKETKLGMNSVKPKVKYTKIEHTLDRMCIGVFITQWIIAFLTGTYADYINRNEISKYKYLGFTSGFNKYQTLVIYVRFFLLTSYMIPISMKITLDMCKYVYVIWIERDRKMIDQERQIFANVNNSSVVEDLGMIEYIFTDKTGTLTENKMELKKIAILNDVEETVYGHSENSKDIYDDQQLMNDIRNFDRNVYMAIYVLSMCHTLKLHKSSIGSVDGVSPEEKAFIEGIQRLGFEIHMKSDIFKILYHNSIQKIPNNSQDFIVSEFQLLYTLPFSYQRKRMSVIVKSLNDNKIFVLSKGASDKILNISDKSEKIEEKFKNRISSFASFGYRTMALSYREITETELHQFHNNVENNRNDNEKLESLFFDIENHSKILGSVAIEDQLQQDVPYTISQLRKAGIRIWMLTGDILDTSIKIATSSHLISDDGPLFDLTKIPMNITTRDNLANNMSKNMSKQLNHSVDEILDSILKFSKENGTFYLALSCDGENCQIENILTNKKFVEVASQAKSVICSRATPKQKALIVKSIKDLGKMTLTIGDGGNDVTMLRESQIGIGIVGKEGLQAAFASDFSITHFRFLLPLLLIHGRFSSYRTSWLTQFSFYKSEVLALIQIFYMYFSGFSGVSFLHSFNLLSYNSIFTLLPVIFFLIDKDVSDSTIYLHPFLYKDSQRSLFLNQRTVFSWMIRGFYQSLSIIYFIFHFYDIDYTNNEDGSTISLDEIQQVTYSALILIVMMTVVFATKLFTLYNFFFIFGNWCLYVLLMTFMSYLNSFSQSLFLFGNRSTNSQIYNINLENVELTKEIYLIMLRVLTNPIHWISIFTIVSVAIFPPVIFHILLQILLPTRAEKLREQELLSTQDFQPPYMVNCDDLYEGSPEQLLQLNEIYHQPSVFETANDIFPIFNRQIIDKFI
ncbi:Phospholipid-transporting ATPase 2 [Tritrichomonas foetus]|uniref:Phospholipid-transporting ATPase n=1 Tax=Tritrichomonas foetus TaxID=1144522 RepID=A0A1J4KGJ4_9EUKA|nr:Phospholipid-transporting ATPase 2 [Tritrichomonas foetus]|eukprot:OHT08782.1 Phospholipid-transporting ATPase 2 [Tritrichomonas foetus]